jgi:hypothetical protein
MGDKTVLPISKTDLNELRIKLDSYDDADRVEARQRLSDLLWEAVHCPPDLTWLQPSPTEA